MSEYISKHIKEDEQRVARERHAAMLRANEAAVFLTHNSASVDLMKFSLARGMSRAARVRIWGERLVSAVSGSLG